jgi:serine/threonine protein kinase
MTLPSGTKLGPYEIVALLGAGGMGEVYRARDTKLGRDVAIKVLPSLLSVDPDRLHRFEQEACAAGALNHPNILVIHHIDTHEGAPYIVSEMLDGETLRERMRGASLPQRKAIDYGLQIAQGLAAAHEKGIVHRDLKPENLFVTKDGRLKILDFGLAKLALPDVVETEAPTRRVNTNPGVVIGTVGYMSPEQVRGQVVDHRSDIFSFGAVLYEMLSGQRAFHRASSVETMSAILKEEPPDLSETNKSAAPGLQRVIDHCLEKNAEERFQSARDLAFALQALSSSSDQTITSALPAQSFRIGRWERPVWIAVVAILLCALILSIYFRNTTAPREMRATRFFVSPPEQSTVNSALISPDGRSLAMRVADSSHKFSLWLRPMDSLEAHPLNGTQDLSFYFWSPDSRFIGFFSNGKLKKIDTTGGVPQTLCDAADARGGTWNREGVILFAPASSDGLYRVAASGGPVSPVTRLDVSRNETSHRFPYFLPDGKHFLYLAITTKREDAGVCVGALDGQTKRLIDTTTNAAYALQGYLLFMRDPTLMVQRFDPTKLELSGDPIPIAEQLNVNLLGAASFSVSDDGILTYLGGGPFLSQLDWFDRSGKMLGSIGATGRYSNVSLSPDGTRVAVATREVQTAARDIWILDSVRSSRFTFNAADEWLPIWSPDGSNIVFTADENGLGNLFEKPTSGASSEVEILNTDARKWPSDWSRDGRYIIFTAFGKTKLDLWYMPLEGDRKPVPFLQSPFNEDVGRFSPDGRFVAYMSDQSGQNEIYVQTFPPSSAQWQVSTDGGAGPIWSRDGKELFYLSPTRKLMAVDVKLGDNSFEAGVPKVLFQTRGLGYPGPRNSYDVSPDGQHFLIISTPADTPATPVTVVTNWAADLKR